VFFAGFFVSLRKIQSVKKQSCTLLILLVMSWVGHATAQTRTTLTVQNHITTKSTLIDMFLATGTSNDTMNVLIGDTDDIHKNGKPTMIALDKKGNMAKNAKWNYKKEPGSRFEKQLDLGGGKVVMWSKTYLAVADLNAWKDLAIFDFTATNFEFMSVNYAANYIMVLTFNKSTKEYLINVLDANGKFLSDIKLETLPNLWIDKGFHSSFDNELGFVIVMNMSWEDDGKRYSVYRGKLNKKDNTFELTMEQDEIGFTTPRHAQSYSYESNGQLSLVLCEEKNNEGTLSLTQYVVSSKGKLPAEIPMTKKVDVKSEYLKRSSAGIGFQSYNVQQSHELYFSRTDKSGIGEVSEKFLKNNLLIKVDMKTLAYTTEIVDIQVPDSNPDKDKISNSGPAKFIGKIKVGGQEKYVYVNNNRMKEYASILICGK
jgi:hypothetical protein